LGADHPPRTTSTTSKADAEPRRRAVHERLPPSPHAQERRMRSVPRRQPGSPTARTPVGGGKGEKYAEPRGFPLRWDAGAPMPHRMVNDNGALLVFLLSKPAPGWDGSYVTVKSPGDAQPADCFGRYRLGRRSLLGGSPGLFHPDHPCGTLCVCPSHWNERTS
jgi:hypothetical protein